MAQIRESYVATARQLYVDIVNVSGLYAAECNRQDTVIPTCDEPRYQGNVHEIQLAQYVPTSTFKFFTMSGDIPGDELCE